VPEDELAQKQRSWCSAAAEVLVECPSVAAVGIVLLAAADLKEA